MTQYMILRRDLRDDGELDPELDPACWRFHAEAEASGAERAIRSIKGLGEGVYVAVPARSWRPLTVTVETTTKISVK
jgi:hypothetical protein